MYVLKALLLDRSQKLTAELAEACPSSLCGLGIKERAVLGRQAEDALDGREANEARDATRDRGCHARAKGLVAVAEAATGDDGRQRRAHDRDAEIGACAATLDG